MPNILFGCKKLGLHNFSICKNITQKLSPDPATSAIIYYFGTKLSCGNILVFIDIINQSKDEKIRAKPKSIIPICSEIM